LQGLACFLPNGDERCFEMADFWLASGCVGLSARHYIWYVSVFCRYRHLPAAYLLPGPNGVVAWREVIWSGVRFVKKWAVDGTEIADKMDRDGAEGLTGQPEPPVAFMLIVIAPSLGGRKERADVDLDVQSDPDYG
jgi:hypothetical protein